MGPSWVYADDRALQEWGARMEPSVSVPTARAKTRADGTAEQDWNRKDRCRA